MPTVEFCCVRSTSCSTCEHKIPEGEPHWFVNPADIDYICRACLLERYPYEAALAMLS